MNTTEPRPWRRATPRSAPRRHLLSSLAACAGLAACGTWWRPSPVTMQLLADDRACTNQAPVLLVLLPGAHMSPEVMLAQGMVEALVSGWTAAFCPGSARRDAAKQGLRRWWHSARPGPDGRPRHSPRRGAACQPTGLLPLRHHHHPQPVATDRPE